MRSRQAGFGGEDSRIGQAMSTCLRSSWARQGPGNVESIEKRAKRPVPMIGWRGACVAWARGARAVPRRARYADATGWAAGLSLQPLAQLQGLMDGLAHPPFGSLCTA